MALTSHHLIRLTAFQARSQPSRRPIQGTRTTHPPPSHHEVSNRLSPYHIGAVPVPAAIFSSHPKQQDGKDDRGTANKSWPWHHIQSAIRSRLRRSHDITRQASSPVGSPSPDTKRRGGKTRRRGANRGRAKRMTTGMTSPDKQASNQPRLMTSPERTRHERREKPCRVITKRERKRRSVSK